jgi:hypothetical protein
LKESLFEFQSVMVAECGLVYDCLYNNIQKL